MFLAARLHRIFNWVSFRKALWGCCQLFHCFGGRVFIREPGCVCWTRWGLELHWHWSMWPSGEIYRNTYLDEWKFVNIFNRRLMALVRTQRHLRYEFANFHSFLILNTLIIHFLSLLTKCTFSSHLSLPASLLFVKLVILYYSSSLFAQRRYL